MLRETARLLKGHSRRTHAPACPCKICSRACARPKNVPRCASLKSAGCSLSGDSGPALLASQPDYII